MYLPPFSESLHLILVATWWDSWRKSLEQLLQWPIYGFILYLRTESYTVIFLLSIDLKQKGDFYPSNIKYVS